LSQQLSQQTKKHLGVRLTVSGWRHIAIGIANRHLTKAKRTWGNDDIDNDNAEDGIDDFAEGDDQEELELDIFRHIMIR
jgi:hypothetical protein